MEDFQANFDKAITAYASANQFGVSMIPAHAHTGADSLHVNYENLDNKTRYVVYRIIGSTTDTDIDTNVGGDFVMPITGLVTGVGATVDTAGSTNTTTIDIKKNGTSIMKTKITIDSGEKTSRTAATPAVLNASTSFVIGDIFTFNIDAISVTPAKGLTVFLNVVES